MRRHVLERIVFVAIAILSLPLMSLSRAYADLIFDLGAQTGVAYYYQGGLTLGPDTTNSEVTQGPAQQVERPNSTYLVAGISGNSVTASSLFFDDIAQVSLDKGNNLFLYPDNIVDVAIPKIINTGKGTDRARLNITVSMSGAFSGKISTGNNDVLGGANISVGTTIDLPGDNHIYISHLFSNLFYSATPGSFNTPWSDTQWSFYDELVLYPGQVAFVDLPGFSVQDNKLWAYSFGNSELTTNWQKGLMELKLQQLETVPEPGTLLIFIVGIFSLIFIICYKRYEYCGGSD